MDSCGRRRGSSGEAPEADRLPCPGSGGCENSGNDDVGLGPPDGCEGFACRLVTGPRRSRICLLARAIGGPGGSYGSVGRCAGRLCSRWPGSALSGRRLLLLLCCVTGAVRPVWSWVGRRARWHGVPSFSDRRVSMAVSRAQARGPGSRSDRCRRRGCWCSMRRAHVAGDAGWRYGCRGVLMTPADGLTLPR